MRKQSLPSLNKKLWKIFSEYIRRKDADINGNVACISCGVKKHFSELHAGHYWPKSVSLALRFDERNVHPQCAGCNTFKHGNLAEYADALEKKWPGILNNLYMVRHSPVKYNRFDYLAMIEEYEAKLKSL
jgi:hypothetical protein